MTTKFNVRRLAKSFPSQRLHIWTVCSTFPQPVPPFPRRPFLPIFPQQHSFHTLISEEGREGRKRRGSKSHISKGKKGRGRGRRWRSSARGNEFFLGSGPYPQTQPSTVLIFYCTVHVAAVFKSILTNLVTDCKVSTSRAVNVLLAI